MAAKLWKLTIFSILALLMLGKTVSADPIIVDVDILPDTINLNANGVIPVAILSSATFDATQVDPLTVELEETSVKIRGNGTAGSIEDINSDGLDDLKVNIQNQAVMESGEVTATLTGQLFDSTPITGTDTVNVLNGVDQTPPSDITDLAASTVATASMDLTWTAPGDSGILGTATTYDIRYSTSGEITAANFGSALHADDEPAPSPAGTTETFRVTGLAAGTLYWFAMKTSDEAGNTSGVSNSDVEETFCSNPVFPGPDTFGVSGNQPEPEVTQIFVNPGDVEIGQQVIVEPSINDSNGNDITNVTITLIQENTSTAVTASKISGTLTDGVWRAVITRPVDEYCNNYQYNIAATSASGTNAVVTISFK